MTETAHNTFAKDLLGTLLQPLGKVEIDLEAITDRSTLEVHFIPTETAPDDQTLKLVRKCAAQGAAFEAFQSPIDDLEYCCWQDRMLEYGRLGVKLGLLINLQSKQVESYRPGHEPELLESPDSIDCNEVMPGFILSMSQIW
jgi:Putative restriction endonuclease